MPWFEQACQSVKNYFPGRACCGSGTVSYTHLIDVSKLADLPAMADIKVIALDDARMGAERAGFIAQWRQIINAR